MGEYRCLTQLIHWSLTGKRTTGRIKQSEKEEFNKVIEREGSGMVGRGRWSYVNEKKMKKYN
jgi:hypothetical protein